MASSSAPEPDSSGSNSRSASSADDTPVKARTEQNASINAKAEPFSALICFEDTVAPLAAKAVRSGARWLVNQTNDAWFDPSGQSEQHLAHAVFRCIENRVPMARACNTGVSCLIDRFGAVQRSITIRSEGFASGELKPLAGDRSLTFYTRYGDRFVLVCALVSASGLLRAWRRLRGRRGMDLAASASHALCFPQRRSHLCIAISGRRH